MGRSTIKRYLLWMMSLLLFLYSLGAAAVRTDAETFRIEDFRTARLLVEATNTVEDTDALEVQCICEKYYVLIYADAQSAWKAYKRLKQEENVLHIQPDERISLDVSEASGEEAEESAWVSEKLGMDVFRRSVQTEEARLPLVKVAVLDTGIDMDLDNLEGRILTGGKNYVSSNPEALPEDDHGHGTMVSNIIADNTFGNVQLLPLKVMDKDGEGYDSHIVAAIAYAIEYGVDIVNMSIGGNGRKEIYQDLIDRAEQMGIAVIVAAGNERRNVSGCTPANVTSAITISSIDRDDRFSTFSNYGTQIDFCAPGENLVVRGIGDRNYKVSGTSFAAPYATASFALVKSVSYDRTSAEIYELLKTYAVDLGTSGWDREFGYGRINLAGVAQVCSQVTVPRGDVNRDFLVNVIDAYTILQYIAGEEDLDMVRMHTADMDGDGSVTVLDVLEILKLTVQKI